MCSDTNKLLTVILVDTHSPEGPIKSSERGVIMLKLAATLTVAVDQKF